jgi:hypothetical protein
MEADLDIIIEIGPTGFKHPVLMRFVSRNDEINLAGLTKGEGQALRFRLVDADCSSRFHQALNDGRVMQDLKGVLNEVQICVGG